MRVGVSGYGGGRVLEIGCVGGVSWWLGMGKKRKLAGLLFTLVEYFIFLNSFSSFPFLPLPSFSRLPTSTSASSTTTFFRSQLTLPPFHIPHPPLSFPQYSPPFFYPLFFTLFSSPAFFHRLLLTLPFPPDILSRLSASRDISPHCRGPLHASLCLFAFPTCNPRGRWVHGWMRGMGWMRKMGWMKGMGWMSGNGGRGEWGKWGR